MKDLLAPAERPRLSEFARAGTLLALDYDGTLAPITESPAQARMRPRTQALLRSVASRYPCVVISGRAQADVQRLLGEALVAAVIGNHGAEPWAAGAPLRDAVHAWLPVLHAQLDALPGVVIEDKRFSIAVHYRAARDPARARAAVVEVASRLPNARMIGGKEIINLVLVGAPHKGDALLRERARLRCERAIYVGDDDTDEDAFAMHDPAHLLTVRVGDSSASRAGHYLENQLAIDTFLQALIDLHKD